MDLPQQLQLMRENIKGRPGADRIHGFSIDMLASDSRFPDEQHHDVIWMSQFLDCFSEDEIIQILKRTAAIMDDRSTLFIMETLWDRQRYEPAAFCLTQISLYFTAIANGNSKMYHGDDLIRLIRQAGLKVKAIHDHLGQGHSMLECKI